MPLPARFAVHQKQRVHAHHHLRRFGVLRLQLHRIDELTPRVRPAAHMHKLRPAHAVVGLIAVGLQNPFPVAQKLQRTIPPATHAKIEYRFAARLAILP